MKVSVSEFKAKCTRLLRQLAVKPHEIEITNRGKVIAVVRRQKPRTRPEPKEFLGCLRGTASYVGDVVSPVAEDEWEACR